jgi:Zn-dependent protease
MRDRDPSLWTWTVPWQPWGVTVRVHLLFPCVVVGVLLRVATAREYAASMWWEAAAIAGMLVLSVVAHEIGHWLAARRLNGDVPEVILWPFGSLAFADVPETSRHYFWTAIGGIAVSLGLALASGGALIALGFIPSWNPLASSLSPQMRNWRDGRIYSYRTFPGQAENYYYVDPENPQRWLGPVKLTFAMTDDGQRYLAHQSEPVEFVRDRDRSFWRLKGTPIELEPARLTAGPTWLARLYIVNWLLCCVNLLPALPLDGGRLLQSWLWRKGERRQSIATAAYFGFIVVLAVGVYAIVVNELLPAIFAAVLYLYSHRELVRLEREWDDLSDDESNQDPASDGDVHVNTAPRRAVPRKSWWQRFWEERAERRRLRELARREAEERRLDELLEKILQHGRSSLTEEEIRFLRRMSSRYSANHRNPRDTHA